MSQADFWDNPGGAGDSPVVRHAPDSHNYHVPDPGQLDKMRGSKVGRFAIIPAANNDGTSKGFDPTVAGPVHVDPYAPDGGVVFDPTAVRPADMQRAVATSKYPHQAFYQLGTPAPALGLRKAAAYQPPEQEVRHGFTVDYGQNPHMPGAYVTPAQPPRAYEEPMTPPPMPAPAPYPPAQNAAPAPQPAPQQPAMPQAAYYQPPTPYAPPPLDPNIQAMMHAMMGVQQQVAALVQRQAPPPPAFEPPTTGLSRVPLPVGPPQLATLPVEAGGRPGRARPDSGGDEEFADQAARPIRARRGDQPAPEADPPQSFRDYARADEPEGVIVGFESLNLPFVTGPMPNKPKRQVRFKIPNAGEYMARFHSVIDAKTCVVLVYDTRYEEGQQFIPPELEEGNYITLTIHGAARPGKKGDDGMRSYRVGSHGLNYQFGVFDHIMLVKVPAQDEDEPAPDDPH